MKALIIGGTGTVGSHVVSGLVAKGVKVRILSRKNKNIDGVEVVTGDLNNPDSVRPIFESVDSVFMLNGLSQTETSEGLVAVSLARVAKLKRFVYMSVQNAHVAPYVPHLGSKIAIEAAVKASGIPYTILQPNMFFQNDIWLKDTILNGVYPTPVGNQGCNSVDARDIASAAVRALTTQGHDFEGKSFVIAGPTLLNGSALAKIWSAKVDKKVVYSGNDLDVWAQHAGQRMPPWMVYDIRLMFQHFQAHGLAATPKELSECEKIVGQPLRTFDSFASEVAASWR